MKRLFIFLFLLPAGGCFGQEPGITQFWNNYGFINPATDGTVYRHQAALTGHSDFYDYGGRMPFTATAVYGTRFDKIHSGLGVHYRYQRGYGYSRDQRIGLNYNYQFRIAQVVDVSVGVGLDVENLTRRDDYYHMPSITIYRNWLLNTGFLARYKHLSVGGSLTALNQPQHEQKYPSDYLYFPSRGAFLHAEYVIPFGEFELTPRVLAEISRVFQTSPQLTELTVNVQATYAKRYWLGAGYQLENEQVTAMIGWDIREKYRVGYAYNFYVDKLSFEDGIHELTLAIQLK